MKIGIMTFHWATNYGAILQTYALSKVLEDSGHDVSIINYYPKKYKNTFIKVFLSHRPDKIFKRLKLLKKENKLSAFREKYLNTTEYINSSKKLKEAKFGYDCYICGSDQIWNPSFVRHAERGLTLSYFLDFVPEDALKISYAASFGVQNYPEELKAAIKENLNTFDGISVREKTGLDILKDIEIFNAELLPDPTILLDASVYKNLLNAPKRTEKYDFVYMLHGRENDAKPLLEKRKAEGVVDIHSTIDSIEDWLTEIYGADLVITNSFHGIVFSILFEKNFAPVLIKGSGMNDRIITLLDYLGLSDRICENIETFKNNPIDWQKVNKRLEDYRSLGHSYLNRVLRKKEENKI